jgi:DNA-nicking Smr family endonuclease|tara:strand:+ start:106 stop:534 length:429 start_codon:yes stop_codon:yes gene_type:complete
LNKKISDKDKKDWQNFLKNKEKLPNKDLLSIKSFRKNLVKKVDLHGLSLDDANNVIYKFINKCFEDGVFQIIVITGKGLRSKNKLNPYVSKDLSILKYSVPEFIKNNKNLHQKIIQIKDAEIEDGGSGAFYVFLKNKLKNKL